MNTEKLIDLIIESIAEAIDIRLEADDEAAEVALRKLQLRWNEERPLDAGGTGTERSSTK